MKLRSSRHTRRPWLRLASVAAQVVVASVLVANIATPAASQEQQALPGVSVLADVAPMVGQVSELVPIELEILPEPPQLGPDQIARRERALEETHGLSPLPEHVGPLNSARFVDSPEAEEALPPLSGEPLSTPNSRSPFFNELHTGPSGFVSNVNEPSVAANRNVFFTTYNWHAAVSTDYGETWGYVDPFTRLPYADGGFCCDQKVIYVPSHDMVIWLLQYIKDGVDNRYRFMVFRGLSETANATLRGYYFDVLSNQKPGYWLDFPDISFTRNTLYVSANLFAISGNAAGGAVSMTFSLDKIASQTITSYGYWLLDGGALPFYQTFRYAPDGTMMYWLAHKTTGTTTVFRAADGGGLFADEVALANVFSTGGFTCAGAGGGDPCGRLDWRHTGAFLWENPVTSQKEIVGMWASGPTATPSRTRVHMRFARFTTASPSTLVGEGHTWSSTSAWFFGSGASNGRGGAGGTIFAINPGSGGVPRCDIWLADEIDGLPATSLTIVSTSTHSPSDNKWGDYLETRAHYPHDNSYVATCFRLNGGSTRGFIETNILWFGRNRDFPHLVRGKTAGQQ